MATFVATTLDKRTGSTTTTFNPSGKTGEGGSLLATGTFAGLGPELRLNSKVAGTGTRVSKVRITLPQLEESGDFPIVKAKPYIETILVVPPGTLQSDVNDLVGYMNDATSTGTTNVNSILVDGVGVY